jgi:hypothetical protein
MRIKLTSIAATAVVLGLATFVARSTVEAQSHVLINAADLKWSPAPPGLPAGAQVSPLSGDPGKPGPFILAVKFPDGYIVRPHWHPTAENLTVLSGSLLVGMGDKYAEASMKNLDPKGFATMPAKTNHFVKAKGETMITISGTGPFEITYVDPKDDPRKK